MKTTLITLFAVIIVAALSMSLVTPGGTDNQGNSSAPAFASAIPDSVNAIFERSCYPCHSEPGKGMAMSKLNFDKWNDYKPEKQADKADDICSEVTKNSMPPKNFRANNPDKVPTETEVKMICAWAASFGKK